MRRESQYIEDYLDTCAVRPITPASYLASRLRGRAATYSLAYKTALMAAIERRVQAGTVEACESLGHRIAYRRVQA